MENKELMSEWKKNSIRIGTPTNLLAAFTSFIPVIWLCITYNCWPDPKVVLAGWGMVALSFGAFNGGILALGLFFGRTEQDGPTNPKSVKCMELTHELHDWFKRANGKNAICCRVLTKEFNMGQGEHKEQCIYFTGLCAWKVAQIVCRELGIKNLDEIDEPCERRKIADI